MRGFVTRNATTIVVALAVAMVGLGALTAVALVRTSSLQDDLETLRADMDRVESGAAIFASQITGFQDQLTDLAPTVGASLDEAIVELEGFATSTLAFMVPIDETIPINTEIVLDRTLTVPIQTTLPINETIATTITVTAPFGVDIPVDVTVPVDFDLPIDLELDFPINETVPIETSVPVNLTVPIEVPVADTELARLADSLRQGLIGFQEVIDGLGG